MKKLLLIMLMGLTTSLAAENPPENYQRFKHEVESIEVDRNKVNLTTNQKAWIGVGIGAAAFVTTEYFFWTGNRQGYHKSILVGMAVHLTYQVIVMSTKNRNQFKNK